MKGVFFALAVACGLGAFWLAKSYLNIAEAIDCKGVPECMERVQRAHGREPTPYKLGSLGLAVAAACFAFRAFQTRP